MGAALGAGEKVPSASFPEGRPGPVRGSLPGGLASGGCVDPSCEGRSPGWSFPPQ